MGDTPQGADLPKDKLTKEDLELIKGHSAKERGDAVKYITIHYSNGDLPGEQGTLASTLFENIAKDDTDSSVKRNLAEGLKVTDKKDLHDVVMLLSQDEESVAEPILSEYKHFSKEEVNDFIEKFDNQKRSHLAKRDDLDHSQTTILIETNDPDVVTSLLENNHSKLKDEHYSSIVKTFHEHEKVMHSFVGRNETPSSYVMDITKRTSNKILASLYSSYKKKFEQESISLSINEEGRVVSLNVPVSRQTDDVFSRLEEKDIDIDHMPFLSLCMGYVEVFDHVVVSATKVDFQTLAETLVDEQKFKELCEKSDFDVNLIPAAWAVYATAKGLYLEKTPLPHEIYRFTKEAVMPKLTEVSGGEVLIDLFSKAYDD
jgi:uncharacterized protein (DUF2336 family)